MNKTLRKVLSLILTIMMIVSVLPFAVTTASAAGNINASFKTAISTDSTRGTDSKLTVCSDGAQGSTSAVLIKFDISSFPSRVGNATLSLNAYVCSKPNNSAEAIIIPNVKDRNITGTPLASGQVSDIFGTSFSANSTVNAQNAYNAFSPSVDGSTISAASAIGTIKVSSLSESEKNISYDVTDAVNVAKANNVSTFQVLIMYPTSYSGSDSNGWSDIYFNNTSNTFNLRYEDAEEETEIDYSRYGTVSTTPNSISFVHGTFYNDNDRVSESDYAQVYQNLIYAQQSVGGDDYSAGAVDHTFVSDDTGYRATQQLYYPTVVMLYDGQNIPSFGAMFRTIGTTKPGSWDFGNLRIFAVGFASNQDSLVFKNNKWIGKDEQFNFQWTYLAHTLESDAWATTYDQTSSFHNDLNNGYITNIIQFVDEDGFSESYKQITPTIFVRGGWDKKNGYNEYSAIKSVYVLNYKKVLDKLSEIDTFLSTFNQNDWTIKSVNDFYAAVNKLAAFNPSSTVYNYGSSTDVVVRRAANDMDTLIAAVDSTKAALKHSVTFKYYDGTEEVYDVADNGSVASPANTASAVKTSIGSHILNEYSWPTTASNVTTNIIIEETRNQTVLSCNWNEGEITLQPTCTSVGTRTIICVDNNETGFVGCGAAKTESVNKLPHEYTVTIEEQIDATCKDTGKTALMQCQNCTARTGGNVIPVSSVHTPDTDKQENRVEAKCGIAGSYDEVVYCTVCKIELSRESKTIPALSHIETAIPAVAATCTQAGHTAGIQCSLCGITLTAPVTISATGHSYTNYISDNNATCTSNGTKTAICDNCDTVTNTVTVEGTMLDHSWVVISEAVAATCKNTGKTELRECSSCKTREGGEVIPVSTTHTPSAPVKENVVNATCTTAGSYDNVIYCSVCNTKLSTKAMTENAKGHTEIVITAVAATCTTTGLTEGKKCSVCNTIIQAQSVVPKTEHNWVTVSAGTNATCGQAGLTAVENCTTCGSTRGGEEIPATNNHTEVTISAVAATCSKTGLTEGKKCSVCNKITVPQTTIAKLAHTPGTTTTENLISATCTVKGSYDEVVRCSVCNEVISTKTVYTALADHTPAASVQENYKASTCTVAGSYDTVVYCVDCKAEISRVKSDLPLAAHTPVDVPATPATCSETGLSAGTKCFVCNTVITAQTITPKVAHTPSSTGTVENETASTCTVAGTYDYVINCSVCGTETSREQRTKELADHTPAEAVKENETSSTCTVAGYYDNVVYCSVCSAKISSIKVDLPLADHDYGDASCTAPATCKVCSFTSGEAIGHSFKEEITDNAHLKSAANCTEKAVYYYDCIRCDVMATDADNNATFTSGDALGHDYAAPVFAWTGFTATATRECRNDVNHTETVTAEISSDVTVEATCGKEGTRVYTAVATFIEADGSSLIVTDKKNETISALTHIEGEAVTENDVASTCTVKGSYDSVVKCSLCGEEISRSRIEKELGAHTPVTVKGTAATCTMTGLTDGTECSVCHTVINAQTIIPIGEHTPAAAKKENAVPSTCNQLGTYDSVVYCSVCNGLISKETKSETEYAAHTPVAVSGKPATCTETGLTNGTKCSVCNETITAQTEIPLASHTPGSTVKENVVASTCSVLGSYDNVVYCTVCSQKISSTKVNETSYAQHSAVVVPAVEATCTSTGLTEGAVCENCGLIISNQITTEKVSHIPGVPVKTNEVAATCAVKGSYDNVIKCKTCNNIISSTRVETEILEHTLVDVPGREATCSETGLTAGKKCSVCGIVTVAQNDIPLTDHTPVNDVAVAPTCTEDGYSSKVICSVCGVVIDDSVEVIPATGHKFSEWVVTVTATPTSDGEKTSTCAVCGKAETITYKYNAGSLTRLIRFTNSVKMHYVVEYLNGPYAVYNSSTLNWYADAPLRFTVYKYSNSGYTELYVYMNGKTELEPDAEGYYTIPAGEDDCTISVSTTKITDTSGGSGTGGTTAGCGHICHSNNSIVKLIWTVLKFFLKLFNVGQECSCGVNHW